MIFTLLSLASETGGEAGQPQFTTYEVVVEVRCQPSQASAEWCGLVTLGGESKHGTHVHFLAPDAPPLLSVGGEYVWTSTQMLVSGILYHVGTWEEVYVSTTETIEIAEPGSLTVQLVARECGQELFPVDIGAWSKAEVRVGGPSRPVLLVTRKRLRIWDRKSRAYLAQIAGFDAGYIATEACSGMGVKEFHKEFVSVSVDYWMGGRHKGTIHRWVPRDALQWEATRALQSSVLEYVATAG